MRRAAAAAALALLAGCATTSLPPVTAPDYQPEDDERAILRSSAGEQDRLDRSGDVYEDAALEAWLPEVLRRVAPPGALARVPLHVKVLRNYRLNAFALPNGALYVHTGLLARMESEAELAVLLGHELTHATHRHAVRELRDASNWSGAMAGVSTALLGLTAPLGDLAARAAVSGHSRDLEREADREGLRLAAAAGYDITAAPDLFRHLEEFVKEEEDEEEPFFFGSHPRLQERLESCEALVKAAPPAKRGDRNEEGFRRHVSRLLLANARMELDAGRYDAARRDAERHLRLEPKSAPAQAILGEAARRRGDPAALPEAVTRFRAAIQLDPRLPEAYRGLGLSLHKTGDRAGARSALQRYLELDPRAPDRAHVKALLDRPGDST